MRGSRRSRSPRAPSSRRGAPVGRAGPESARSTPASCAAPHLSEDLALAGDHRVQTGGHAKEVERGSFVSQPVERRAELGLEGEQQQPRPAARLAPRTRRRDTAPSGCTSRGRRPRPPPASVRARRARAAGGGRAQRARAARRAPGGARCRRGRRPHRQWPMPSSMSAAISAARRGDLKKESLRGDIVSRAGASRRRATLMREMRYGQGEPGHGDESEAGEHEIRSATAVPAARWRSTR